MCDSVIILPLSNLNLDGEKHNILGTLKPCLIDFHNIVPPILNPIAMSYLLLFFDSL